MRATKRDIMKVEPLKPAVPDWARLNRLIARGFTHLYPLECGCVLLAKKGINQRRAMQLYHGNGHGGVRCGS